MEAIIYNTQAQADALQARLHSKLSSKGRGAGYLAEIYSNGIAHPTDGRVAIPISKRFMLWYREIKEELTTAELNSIETLTSDWFPNIEL